MRGLALMLPEELLFMLIVAGGFSIILGARKLGSSLIATATAMAILPTFLAPLFDALPSVLVYALLVFFALAMVFTVLRWISASLIGERATDGMVGNLAADAVKASIRGVFGLLGFLLRGLGRVLLSLFRT